MKVLIVTVLVCALFSPILAETIAIFGATGKTGMVVV
jgi:hypothetical protein